MATRKEAIVLYPCPGAGHLNSMIEFAKLLLLTNPSLNLHILITTPPFEPPYFPPSLPAITFHHLPKISLDRLDRTASILAQILEILRLNNPNVRETLAAISSETLITALVVDFFCIPAVEVAGELGIPCHLFSTSSASCVALFLHLPAIVEGTASKSFKDMVAGEDVFTVPGLPPLVAADMPDPLQDRMSKEYSYFLEYSMKLPKLAGFVINSFDRLEEKALMALAKGLLLPHGIVTPPVYCVGPLVACDQRSQNHAMATIRKEAIVLYPCPGAGHLNSMIEFAKLLLLTDPSLNLYILITTPPFEPPFFPPSLPAITFHHLPTISLDRLDRTASILAQILEILRLNNPNVRETLAAISSETLITALVVDFFCIPAVEVAGELGIPCHLFSTSSASCVALFLHLPALVEGTASKSFKDMVAGEDVFTVPGLPPLVAADMPDPLQDRMSKEYSYFLEYSMKLPKLAGFVINSFDRLEEKALMALAKGLLLPHGIATPPVYCVGPLVACDQRSQNQGKDGDKAEYLTWLDSQPPSSVIYLCFGSLGFLSADQLHQIAIGLESSNQRFLWFIRTKTNNINNNDDSYGSLDKLSTTLPEGFLDRTRSRGRVLTTWAPQIAILSHVAVGGFVTHCGWNSVLEAVCAGVPMIAWPLYAEQRLNKAVLVEEMKVALPLGGGRLVVTGADVAEKVADLMEPGREEGKAVREKVVAMREEARVAAGEKGTSSAALIKVVDSLKKKKKKMT